MDRKCFVAAPIGPDESRLRRRSDQVLKHIIEPVVLPRGFETVRADQISAPGIITTQVLQHILSADLVIADLTGGNPNVFYELAIRHAARKPVIQMIDLNEAIPFDVGVMRTIRFDIHDLDSADQAKQELARQIDALCEEPLIATPLLTAVDLNRASANNTEPLSGAIAELLSFVANIREGLLQTTRTMQEQAAGADLMYAVVEDLRNELVELSTMVRATLEFQGHPDADK